MARSVKIKQVKKMIGGNNADGPSINSMFEEMMGIKDCETYILAPKFSKMRNICRKIYKILIQFSSFIEFKDNFPEFKEDLSDIESFANLLKEDICFGDSDEPEDKYNTMEKKEMNDIYKKLKENKYIKQLVILCSQLKSYANNFENIKIIQKFINLGKISTENAEFLKELEDATLYPYINFKNSSNSFCSCTVVVSIFSSFWSSCFLWVQFSIGCFLFSFFYICFFCCLGFLIN